MLRLFKRKPKEVREFTLKTGVKIRYIKYNDPKLFEKEVLEPLRKQAEEGDIGAILALSLLEDEKK